MQKRFFPLLIAISALAVSGSAAFYSVFGLSKLFAGASTQVIIMAGSLEFAKLVVASLLYQYWSTINKFLRTYLMVACFILMIITSGGIYGFLSGAYQSTATESELLDKSLAIIQQKQVRFEETKQDLKIEKQGLTNSISDLRLALSNPQQVQYIDRESGLLITTSSSSARNALKAELKTSIAERDKLNIKTEAVMDSINKTDMALLDKEITNEGARELGPLKYLAETTGQPMNQVVNWFLLLIIIVFDPLAIALVIAANMAFAQLKPEVKMSVPEGMEFNKPSKIVEELTSVENQSRIKDQEYSQDNWNSKVAETPNPNSIVDKVKVEKQDIVMDDLEDVTEGKRFAKGLGVVIDVLEEEQAGKAPLQQSTSAEHELYHGTPGIVDEPVKKSLSDTDKRRRKRVVKVVKRPHNPNPYKG